MRGRPKKYETGDPPIRINFYIPASIRYKIPEDLNLTEFFTNLLTQIFDDPKKVELKELEKKELELKEELAIIQSKILKIRREIEEAENIRKAIELKNLYAIWEFWKIIQSSIKIGKLNFSGNKYPEQILGIKFEYDKVGEAIENKDIISYSVETFEQTIQLSKQFNVQYIGKGEREKEEFDKFIKFYENYKKEVKA
ncbi:MAG: hypothetical protein ACP5IB_08105 [Thermoplasmata archaeon]